MVRIVHIFFFLQFLAKQNKLINNKRIDKCILKKTRKPILKETQNLNQTSLPKPKLTFGSDDPFNAPHGSHLTRFFPPKYNVLAADEQNSQKIKILVPSSLPLSVSFTLLLLFYTCFFSITKLQPLGILTWHAWTP